MSLLYNNYNSASFFVFQQLIPCIQAVAGLLADARQVVEVARDESSNFRYNYGGNIPLKVWDDPLTE